jgi:outer membrane protein TolC
MMVARLLTATAVWGVACARAANPLSLDDVLASVEKNYPPLLVALAERDIAAGELLQAQGRFDLNLGAQVDTDRLGYYENERLNAGLEQAFSTWGTSAYAGWRTGTGSFATYDGKLDTRSLGEWRAGVRIPLVRNRTIDDRRAGVQKAGIGRRIADLSVDQQRIAIIQAAARRYWDWVASGQRLRVARDVLRIAEDRDRQLREAAALGQIAAVEVTENQRQILQRQAQLVEAERGVQQYGFELSLFYRDASGNPIVPQPSQLPPALPATAAPPVDQLETDLDFALQRRPDLARLSAQREQTQVDVALAENERRPALDLNMGFTSESGTGVVRRGPQEWKGALVFQVPWQRRAAAGKQAVAEAKVNQFTQRERFTRDQIEAEVRDAASAVRAAHERALLAKEEVRVALDLADAERERFRLGDSTLFTVNLREQAAVDAELRDVGAVNDYLRAVTVYEQATARRLAKP